MAVKKRVTDCHLAHGAPLVRSYIAARVCSVRLDGMQAETTKKNCFCAHASPWVLAFARSAWLRASPAGGKECGHNFAIAQRFTARSARPRCSYGNWFAPLPGNDPRGQRHATVGSVSKGDDGIFGAITIVLWHCRPALWFLVPLAVVADAPGHLIVG